MEWFNPEDFICAVRPNTKAFICTHGSNLTGNVLDVKALVQQPGRGGFFLWWMPHRLPESFDIDVQKMNIDILCFTGHKGLLGPQGTGGMYVRAGAGCPPTEIRRKRNKDL